MMKFFLKLMLCCLSIFSLQAEIVETAHFKDIANYISEDTLVLLDIDDTLLIPVQTLGTDVWFLYRLNLLKDSGLSEQDAVEKALAEWEAVRHLTEVKIVEDNSDAVIKDLQNKKISLMGLTTQGLALATRTVLQLKTLGIDLSLTPPSHEAFYFDNSFSGKPCVKTGVLFRHGILFTSGTNKGKALLKLFEKMSYKPQHIVFINDKLSHLREVETALIQEGIPFTGLRYSYSDERVANFSEEIADIQWKHSRLHTLLSDEEAVHLLSNKD